MTVSLRPFVASDSAWVDGWLRPVAASVGYDEFEDEIPSRAWASARATAPAVRIIEREDEKVGVLIFRTRKARRAGVVIELVATPPHAARRGSGMQAAAQLEIELRAAGARSIYAPAPSIHGIAMYFWIRLGYRPILSPEWPCTLPGVAWLRRDL